MLCLEANRHSGGGNKKEHLDKQTLNVSNFMEIFRQIWGKVQIASIIEIQMIEKNNCKLKTE